MNDDHKMENIRNVIALLGEDIIKKLHADYVMMSLKYDHVHGFTIVGADHQWEHREQQWYKVFDGCDWRRYESRDPTPKFEYLIYKSSIDSSVNVQDIIAAYNYIVENENE